MVRAAAARVLAKSLGKREEQLQGLAGGCNVLQGRGGWDDLAKEEVEGPGQVGVPGMSRLLLISASSLMSTCDEEGGGEIAWRI